MAYTFVDYGRRKVVGKNRTVSLPASFVDFAEVHKSDSLFFYYALTSKTVLVSKHTLDRVEELIDEVKEILATLERKSKENSIPKYYPCC